MHANDPIAPLLILESALLFKQWPRRRYLILLMRPPNRNTNMALAAFGTSFQADCNNGGRACNAEQSAPVRGRLTRPPVQWRSDALPRRRTGRAFALRQAPAGPRCRSAGTACGDKNRGRGGATGPRGTLDAVGGRHPPHHVDSSSGTRAGHGLPVRHGADSMDVGGES